MAAGIAGFIKKDYCLKAIPYVRDAGISLLALAAVDAVARRVFSHPETIKITRVVPPPIK